MKQFTGTVVSTKMQKTAVIKVNTFRQHPIYKKQVKHSQNYLVHDEAGVKLGDKVIFQETRPISKRKKWKITEVIKKI